MMRQRASLDSGYGFGRDDTDDDYTRKKKDAVTSRGRKAHRLQLSERHHSEDAHETQHMRSKHHKPWSVPSPCSFPMIPVSKFPFVVLPYAVHKTTPDCHAGPMCLHSEKLVDYVVQGLPLRA